MMAKRFLLGILVVLFVAGSALASPGRFAYVLRFDDQKSFLVQFNIDEDKIIKEIPLSEDSGFNNFIVDEKGGCYMAKYRTSSLYGREIHYYNPSKKRIKKILSLKDVFGPRNMVLTPEQLIVEVKGRDRSRLKSGILFIDRRDRKVKNKIFIQEDNAKLTKVNINDLFFDGERNLFSPSFYVENIPDKPMHETSRYGDIFVIDLQDQKIVKTIKVPKEYLYLGGVVNVGDKVYVAAGAKGKRDLDDFTPPNQELLVFSLKSGALIKKIKISPHPFRLAYDKSVNKLYVQHMDDKYPRNTVEVIDTKTDKVIKRLNIPSQLMFSVVKPGKMYITVGAAFLTSSRTKPALLVLDTKTDKIIKKIYGNYKGISVNTMF